jgi:hypothetical protein
MEMVAFVVHGFFLNIVFLEPFFLEQFSSDFTVFEIEDTTVFRHFPRINNFMM